MKDSKIPLEGFTKKNCWDYAWGRLNSELPVIPAYSNIEVIAIHRKRNIVLPLIPDLAFVKYKGKEYRVRLEDLEIADG